MKQFYALILTLSIVSIAITSQVNHLKVADSNFDITEAESLESKEYKGFCFVKIHNYFYDLNGLSGTVDINPTTGRPIQLKFCDNLPTDCDYAKGLVVSKERCKKYAGDSEIEKTWSVTTNAKGQNVLSVNLPQGDVCMRNKNGVIYYNTTLEITCDETQIGVNLDQAIRTFNPNKCDNLIRMSSRQACKRTKFNAWWNRFGINKKGVATVLILVGLYFLIFGVLLWKTNSLIINCLILGLILFNILSLFTKVSLVVCLLLGIALSISVLFFESANGTILGVVVGYLFGNLLYNFLVKLIHVNPQTLYWSTILTCILGISVAGGFMKNYMVACATSLVGAYSFVRGISIFLGGYPDEQYVMKLINKREYNQFSRVFGPQIYGYLVSIIAVAILGMILQSCCCINENAENKENKTEEKPPVNVIVMETNAKIEENNQNANQENLIKKVEENKTEN